MSMEPIYCNQYIIFHKRFLVCEIMRSGETGIKPQFTPSGRKAVQAPIPNNNAAPTKNKKKAKAALKHVSSPPPSTVTVRCCRDGNPHNLASRATPSPSAKKTPKSTSSSSSKSTTTTKKMAVPEPNLKHQIHSLRHVLIPGLSIH